MIHLINDKTIYIVGMYPSPETGDNREPWEYNYRALAFAYNCNVQLIREPNEAMNLQSLVSVAIEQKNENSIPLPEFVHPERAVYYAGNSKYPTPSYWANTDMAVHIDTPGGLEHSLYGHQAAAIVLHDRMIKYGSGV